MSNQYLKLRRSNVQGRIPTTESIDFGEIALNTYDGLAYMKKSGSNGIEVVPIGSSTGSFSGDFTGTFTGSLQGTASWAENYNETDPIFTAISGTFTTTSSFNSFTASYNTGSFTGIFSGSFSGSGANLFDIPASGILGLNLNRIATGSVTASVNTTGNIFTVASSSANLLTVSSSGVLVVASSASLAFGRSVQIAPFADGGSVSSFSLLLEGASGLRLRTTSNNSINFNTNNLDRWYIEGAGSLTTAADNVHDIGLSGSRRPRNIYAAGTGSVFAALDITFGSTNALKTFPSTGNTFLGSTPVDGGFKLDVNGTARIQNTLTVSAGGANITGNAVVSSAVTSSTLLVSGSGTQRVTILGSGSAQPLFTVQGSQGELFSIVDSLSGSLFSVNDISGLPIMEVFSDSTTLMGNYLAPSLNTTFRTTTTNSGSFAVYAVPTSSYDGIFMEYTAKSGSNARAGQFMAIWSGSQANFTDNTTTDFGNTARLMFTGSVSGSNLVVTGNVTTGSGWTIKAIIRSI